jgi:hypothetical protein
MTFEDVRAIALELPGVEETAGYGAHAFAVRKKQFLRFREEDQVLVLRTDAYEREHLLSTAPSVFFVDDRIRQHPWVFARLAAADPVQLAELVRDAWRRVAPRRMVEAFDEARS